MVVALGALGVHVRSAGQQLVTPGILGGLAARACDRRARAGGVDLLLVGDAGGDRRALVAADLLVEGGELLLERRVGGQLVIASLDALDELPVQLLNDLLVQLQPLPVVDSDVAIAQSVSGSESSRSPSARRLNVRARPQFCCVIWPYWGGNS